MMRLGAVGCAALVWGAAGGGAAQDSAQDAEPAAGYPAGRQERELAFYNLRGDYDLGELRMALAEVSVEIAYGPRTAAARPGWGFVALDVPAALERKLLEKALRKGGAKAEELAFVLFRGRVGEDEALPNFGTAAGPRDHILGMSGEIRWFESAGGWTEFFCEPKKLDPKNLEDRYRKLYEPFGGGTLGEVVRESFVWELAASPEPALARKLEKELAKIEGVLGARIAEAALEVEVELAGLLASGPPLPFPAEKGAPGAAGDGPPRCTFPTNALLEVLEKHGAQLAAGPSDGEGE